MRRVALVAAVVICALVACGGETEAKVQPYDRAPVPSVPDHTHPVATTGAQADGDYWATATGDDITAGAVEFTLVQVFFGTACIAALGADQCDGEMGVQPDPSVTLTAPVADLLSVSVAAANRQNYAVPGSELLSLVGGNPPGARAPADYTYQQFPFLVTVEGGVVTEAHQIWMP